MDDNDNMKYGIEFDAQIGKGFSSTIGKVKREIGKIPEERTLRFSAKTNFKHLDQDMKNSLKSFEQLQRKMTGKNVFGGSNPVKGLANYLFGDRNKWKQMDAAFEKTKLRAIQARQEQFKALKNLMGTNDINSDLFTDDSLVGQTSKAYAEQAQVIDDLKNKLQELTDEKERLTQQQTEINLLPNEQKVVAQINNVMTNMEKLRAKIERYKKVDIGGEQAQKQINDISERMYTKTEQLTRVAIGHAHNTGNDSMYRELRKLIRDNMTNQLSQLDDVKSQLETAQKQYDSYSKRITKLTKVKENGVRDLTAEEEIELKGMSQAVDVLDQQIRDLGTRKNKIEIYAEVNKNQLNKMTALWKKRFEINMPDEKTYNRNNAENYFAGGKNTLMNLQDTLSNRVTGTVSTGYIKDLENQLEAARQKKIELDDTLANVVPMNEQNITDIEQKIAETEEKMKEVEKQIKLANGTSGELEKRWQLLNNELAELRNQWGLLNEDMQANPMKEQFRSDDMQGANGIWDTINAKATKWWQIMKRNNAITRLTRRVLTQIRNTIANLINPLNLWNKGWNSWLDRVENKRLKNTFEMIKYNLVTAFEPLFEKFAQFLLKLAQVANIFTKKFAGVDLFDSKDWKKNKAMIDQLTASFDELHANGENTDTIFDSGDFKMEPLSADQIKFWEGMADKIKKAWEGVKNVFKWIIDHWKWLVAAWAAYKIGKGLLGLLDWGKKFGGVLKGLSLGSLLSSLAIAIGAATTLYGIFQDIKLAQKWNQMTPEERNKTADKGDAATGIGGALMGGGIGWKLGGSALGAKLGLTAASGMVAGATFAGGIALGISGTANAITAATNGDFKMVEKESTKAGTGIGMAVGTAVGVGVGAKIGGTIGAFAGPIGAAIGAVVGAGLGWAAGKFATFVGDVGGEFSKLKISQEDLQWATDQYNQALGNEYQALQDLKGMEEATGQSGEALYKAVENGTIKYGELTTEQKILYKAYEDYQKCLQDTAAALKQQTDYENAILKDKAKESGDYGEFITSMLNANQKGIYSAEETQDRLSQVYASLSKDEREIFLKQLPEDMKQGVEDGAYQYYSGWEKFKIGVAEKWNSFKEGWSNFWGGVGTKLSEIWGGITTTAGNIWEGMKTTAGNIWNSIKIEAVSAWDSIKESAIGQKVQEIATNVGEKWNEIKTKAGEAWENVKTTVGEKVETLKTNLSTAWENVKTKAGEVWGGVKTKAEEIWGGIKETVGGKVEELKTAVKEKWENIKTKASETWENIKTKAGETWDNIKNSAIGQKVSEIWTNTKNKFDEIKTNLVNSWNTLKTNASTAWNNIKNSIVDGAKKAWEGAKGFFSKIGEGVKSAWEGIKGFAEKTGQKIGNFFSGKGFKTDSEYEDFIKKHPDLASYDVGTNYVPNDQLAYIHKGEAIIPAKYNKPVSLDNSATNRTNEEIRNLVNQVRELQQMVAQGIKINGQFVQRGADLVATVERASNNVSNRILSNKQFAR